MAFSLSSWPRAIVHVDGDAFFASCEQAIHPELKGKPVITGKERGIVSAASYEAKACGVKRGVPLHEVKTLCPDAIILPSDYETYSLFSKRLFGVMRRFTPMVEEYSIDEAFADVTGWRRASRASYETIALRIQETAERELGITFSVGISLSKVLAKIGSKWKKPSGCTPISGRNIEPFLSKVSFGSVWGIGAQTASYAAGFGIRTALDFARADAVWVRERFAKPAQEIWRELRGESVYAVEPSIKKTYASIGKTKTFTPSSADPAYVWAQVLKNLENACIKVRQYRLQARGFMVVLRRADFGSRSQEAHFSRPSAFPHEIIPCMRMLFEELFERGVAYRATGIVLSGLIPEGPEQISLFDPPLQLEKWERAYRAVDGLRERLGKHTVFLGGALAAHRMPQHMQSRGDMPWRKRTRLPGETTRLHLTIPLIARVLQG